MHMTSYTNNMDIVERHSCRRVCKEPYKSDINVALLQSLKQICFHFPSTIDQTKCTIKRSLHGKDCYCRVFVHFCEHSQRWQLTLVTLNRAPGRVTRRCHVDAGGDHPFLPSDLTADLIPDGESHFTHERSNEVDKVL